MKNLLKVTLLAATVAAFSMGANAQVKIGGDNKQETTVQGAVNNMAFGGSKAVQNVSSNHGKVKIGGNNTQSTTIQGALNNMAFGGSTSVQNLSSNSSD